MNYNNNNQLDFQTHVEQAAMPKKKKSKAKGVIIALVVALVLCVIVIVGLVVLGVVGLGGLGILGALALDKNVSEKVPEVAVVETVEATTEVQETQAPVTEYIGEMNNDYITVPEYVDEQNVCYITYDTPAHAGVNLRETPTDDSVKIMVLPEGTTVTRLNGLGETTQTKYILVSVVVDGVEYTGYVMQRYVSTFSGMSFDSYVSYDTPDHAGLVLRETSSYYSDKIMVVPEGTELRVVDNSTGAYWAVDVFYEGEIYSGYVLSDYIEFME